MRAHRILASCLLAGCCSAHATCWSDAEASYGVSARLLYGIARAESDLDPRAINRSHFARTGSYDIGLMQINSSHLPALARHGIREEHLLDPCTNLMVGAWVLAESFRRHGVSWEAVGAYNAACTQLRGADCAAARSKYAWRVYRRLPRSAETPTARASADDAPVRSHASNGPSTFILSARVTP